MAIKKGAVIAGVVGTAAAPVVGYFVHDHLTSGTSTTPPSQPGQLPLDPAILNTTRDSKAAYEIKDGCVKENFPVVEQLKETVNAASTTKQDVDKNTIGTSSDAIKGCLSAEITWRNEKDKQHAIAGKIELTLSKGDHGLVFRTMLSNLAKEDSKSNVAFLHRNQAFKLKKSGGNWEIEHGYQWTDKTFNNLNQASTENGGPKLLIAFEGSINVDIGFSQLCFKNAQAPDEECADLDKNNFKSEKITKKSWKEETGGKDIFEHLTIKGGEKGKEQLGDLWGKPSKELFTQSLSELKLNPYLYEKDGGFFMLDHNNDKTKENLTKWFEPFKDEKGTWT